MLMARLGVLRAETEEPIEVLKWLDRTLIRLVSKFADYKKEDTGSFRLSKEFSLYPQFMYHLRRSHFIQTFGASPDEITFYRCTLNRESVTNCMVMIQPALLSYTFNQTQPKPVLLDLDNMKNDVILLLDTYFQVVVWYGDHIQQWKNMGYDVTPGLTELTELTGLTGLPRLTRLTQTHTRLPRLFYFGQSGPPRSRLFASARAQVGGAA